MSSGAGTGSRLEDIVAAPEAGHYHLLPAQHSHSGAFLLARVSDDMAKMHACSQDGSPARITSRENAGDGTYRVGAYLTAFRSATVKDETPVVMLLFWEQRDGRWQIVSYALKDD